MKALLFSSLLIFCAFFSSNVQSQNYRFYDDFSDNSNNWDEYKSSDAELQVSSGFYQFEHRRRTGAWTSTHRFDLNPNNDFRIETVIQKVYGINNHGYGIMWGAADSKNYNVFLISGDGHFQVGRTRNGTYQIIVPWTTTNSIQKFDETNKLALVKSNNSVDYYINGSKVINTPYTGVAGNKIGFFINKNVRLSIDELTVESGNSNNTVVVDPTNNSSYPPDLYIENLKFSEPSGNGALDANEKAEISFNLLNKGRGAGKNISIKITDMSSQNDLVFNPLTILAELQPKNSAIVKIPITANNGVVAAVHKLRIETTEENGFDIDPVLITFETVKQNMPKLKLAQVAIDDNKDEQGKGDSYGNGNNTIESGESIEVVAFLQNYGKGVANNVQAQVVLNTTDPNISYPDQGKIYDLGSILPGDYKKLSFYFFTSRRYNTTNIPLYLKIMEKGNSLTDTANLNLKLGKRAPNIIDVVVNNTDTTNNNNSPDVKKIDEVIKPSDVDINIPISQTDGSNTLAVIIGIDQYRYAPRVEFAARDAQIFYEYTKSILGVPERNIFLRTNDGATSGEFNKVIAEDGWLARRIQQDITEVVVYYAGHGAPDSKSKNAFLIPQDIDPNYPSTGISLESMIAKLSALKAKSVTMILDACFSGVSRNNQALLADARTVIIKPKKANVTANMIILSASSDEEYSTSFPEKSHGLFTYYLLKGMRGEAKNGDNIITIKELSDYIKGKVPQQAGFLDKEQHPTIDGTDLDRVFVKF